jgi:hypothetical protein
MLNRLIPLKRKVTRRVLAAIVEAAIPRVEQNHLRCQEWRNTCGPIAGDNNFLVVSSIKNHGDDFCILERGPGAIDINKLIGIANAAHDMGRQIRFYRSFRVPDYFGILHRWVKVSDGIGLGEPEQIKHAQQ